MRFLDGKTDGKAGGKGPVARPSEGILVGCHSNDLDFVIVKLQWGDSTLHKTPGLNLGSGKYPPGSGTSALPGPQE